MDSILLIEDCPEMTLLTKTALQKYNLTCVRSLAEARDFTAENSVDLFLIDINLPDGNGFDFCLELTNQPLFKDKPKIFLSGENEVRQKVFGFSCGADDYITKPFAQLELVARVDAKLRKSAQNRVERILKFEFDHSFQNCFAFEDDQKEDLALTPTEYRLFYSLVKNLEIPQSRRDLVKSIWNTSGLNIEIRGIDSHISHLRKKLKSDGRSIISVYGKGYAYKDLEKVSS